MALVLQFKSSNSGVQTEHHAALADMVAEVSGCPSLALDIKGFSDNLGPELLNATISKQRAEQTAQFLLAQGVRADRMTVVGMADRDPVATNATPDGRARNRRVEVRVYQAADRQQQPSIDIQFERFDDATPRGEFLLRRRTLAPPLQHRQAGCRVPCPDVAPIPH
jgi:OmpA family